MPFPNPSPYRVAGTLLQILGGAATLAGGAALVVASALPWAKFTAFGAHIEVPGVLGVGSLTASLGLLLLAGFGTVRRFPLLGVLLGVAAWQTGVYAERETGKLIVRYLLAVNVRLAPVNARLAEVNLPPVEPFGGAIGAWRDHMGIGITYTEQAGQVAALGSVALLAGGIARRTCRFCHRTWRAKRGDNPHFCPNCGGTAHAVPLCPRCASETERGERFCPNCGESLPAKIGRGTFRRSQPSLDKTTGVV